MGVIKITSEILNNDKLWIKKEGEINVVIDGKNTMYNIWSQSKMNRYRLIFDINKFEKKIEEYFDNLKENGFNVFSIIMDGSTEIKKLSTICERQQDRLNKAKKINEMLNAKSSSDLIDEVLLNNYVERVFFEKVKKMGYNIKIAVCEADNEVEYEARNNNCCVISDDSDYYFVNIPKGYIPGFLIKSGDYRIYNVNLFLKYYNLIPSQINKLIQILGNDNYEPIIEVNEKNRLIKAIQMLKSNNDINPILKSNKVLPDIQLKNTNLLLTTEQKNLYRNYNFDSHLLDIIKGIGFIAPMYVECINKESIWLVSRELRKHLYYLINGEKQTLEYIRYGDSFRWDYVDSKKLNYNYYEDMIKQNNLSQHSLFIFSLIMLIINGVNKEEIINSFIGAYVMNEENYIINEQITKYITNDSIHIVEQYRGILKCIIMIKQYNNEYEYINNYFNKNLYCMKMFHEFYHLKKFIKNDLTINIKNFIINNFIDKLIITSKKKK